MKLLILIIGILFEAVILSHSKSATLVCQIVCERQNFQPNDDLYLGWKIVNASGIHIDFEIRTSVGSDGINPSRQILFISDAQTQLEYEDHHFTGSSTGKFDICITTRFDKGDENSKKLVYWTIRNSTYSKKKLFI
ncbi:hypothetical protein HCN44_010615 [Aphidius gifuensis]|uniref:Venom protein n=1 Tax=Aphidius gifuensis TaxID=684658 RepID=A0A835CPF3_APHGI|nr:hypothetical protein HCN44_010615 [Aphidius gifuensis]